jgi:prevent-host-death family protein
MKQVNIHEAKTQLSKLIALVEKGGEVVIARAGKPVARLVNDRKMTTPSAPQKSNKKFKRSAGILKGKVKLSPQFDDPLPQEIVDAFYGK